MWQRNECGLRKLPSAAVSYSSAGPALGTSGRGENGENRPENTRVGALLRKFFLMGWQEPSQDGGSGYNLLTRLARYSWHMKEL